MIDMEKVKASIPTVDRSTVEKQVDQKTKQQLNQSSFWSKVAKFFWGDESAWGKYAEAVIPDVAQTTIPTASDTWTNFKNILGTPFRAFTESDAVLDPKAYDERKRLDRETLVNNIVSQKLQKQESDIWDRISNEVKGIELEKKQIEQDRANLDPMSTDYFWTLKKLDSRAISLNQKINILSGERDKYLKWISTDIKSKEFDVSPIKSFFEDEDVANNFLKEIKWNFFDDDWSHKATNKIILGDIEWARIEAGKESAKKTMLNAVMKQMYEIGKDKVSAWLVGSIDEYLTSAQSKSRISSLLSSVDDIVQSNPALIDKDTGMINSEEYRKIINANPQINETFKSMEEEWWAFKISWSIQESQRGMDLLTKDREWNIGQKALSFLWDTPRMIYQIWWGWLAAMLSSWNQAANVNFGTDGSQSSYVGKSDVRSLMKWASWVDQWLFDSFQEYVRQNPADIVGAIVSLKTAMSSAKILSSAKQPKLIRSILGWVDEVIKGLPLNIGIYWRTGDYTPRSDLLIDFISGWLGSVKKVVSSIDTIADEAVKIAASKGENAARKFLWDNWLSLVSVNVWDKTDIINWYKKMADIMSDPKSQIAVNEYKKFVDDSIESIDVNDLDWIVSSVKRITSTIGGSDPAKIFWESVSKIWEAAARADVDWVKSIAREVYSQLNASQIKWLLKNNVDQIHLNAVSDYLWWVIAEWLPKLPQDVSKRITSLIMMWSDDVSSLSKMDFFKKNPSMLNETLWFLSKMDQTVKQAWSQLSSAWMKQLSEQIANKEAVDVASKSQSRVLERSYSEAIKQTVWSYVWTKSINKLLSLYDWKRVFDQASQLADDIIQKSWVPASPKLKQDIVNFITMRQTMSSSDAMIELARLKSWTNAPWYYEELVKWINDLAKWSTKADPFMYAKWIPNELLDEMSKAENDIISMTNDSLKYSNSMKQWIKNIISWVASITSPEWVRTVSTMIQWLYNLAKKAGLLPEEAWKMLSKSIDIMIDEADTRIIDTMKDLLYNDWIIDESKVKSFAKNYNMDYEAIAKIEADNPWEWLRALLINKIKTDAILKATSWVKLSTAKKYSSIESFSDMVSDVLSDSMKYISSISWSDDDIFETIFRVSSSAAIDTKVMNKISTSKQYIRHLLVWDATWTSPGLTHIATIAAQEMRNAKPNFVSIPTSYLVWVWREMLEDSIGYKNMSLSEVNAFNDAINLALKKRSAASQVWIAKLFNNFFKWWVLSMKNNWSSVLDLLDTYVDTRKSVSMVKWMWWVIFRPALDLIKHTLSADIDNWKKILKDIMSTYFDRASLTGNLGEENVIKFSKLMWVSNPSDAYVRLYDELFTTLSQVNKSSDLIHDSLNPLLYSVDDYVRAVIESPLNPHDTVLWILNRRWHISWFDELSTKLWELNSLDEWFEYKNFISHLVEESTRSVLKWLENIPVSKDWMYRYLYKELGSNLWHSFMWDSTNALSHRLQLTIDNILNRAKADMSLDEYYKLEAEVSDSVAETLYRVENDMVEPNSEKIWVEWAKLWLEKMKEIVSKIPDNQSIIWDIDDILEQFSKQDPTRWMIDSIMRKILWWQSATTKVDAAEYIAWSENRLVIQDVINRSVSKDTQSKIISELYQWWWTNTLEKMLISEGRSNQEIKEITEYAKKISKWLGEWKVLDADELMSMVNKWAWVWDIVESNPWLKKWLRKFMEVTADRVEEWQVLLLKGWTNITTVTKKKLSWVQDHLGEIVTPATLSNYDDELAWFMKNMEFMGRQPITPIIGSEFADVGTKWLKSFRVQAKSKLYDLIKWKWMWLKRIVKDNDVTIMHNQLVLWSSARFDLVPENARELYAHVISYMSDINEFRIKKWLWPKTYAEVISAWNPWRLNAANIIETITGKWTELSNSDISLLSKKYWSIKNFEKNMIRWWLYSKWWTAQEVWKWVSRFLTTLQIIKMFNIFGNAYKAWQQILSWFIEADWFIKATWIDEEMVEQISKQITPSLWFDIFQWDKFLSGVSDWKISKMFHSLINLTSALTWWDKLMQPKVIRASAAMAFESKVADYGIWYVKQFESKADELFTFMEQFWFRSESEFASWFWSKKSSDIYDKILKESGPELADEFAKKFDELRSFYTNNYRDFVSKTRSYMSAFYVSDNVSEYNFTPIIQRNRNMFGLMKWSMNKTWEYGIKFSEAFESAKWLSGTDWVWKVMSHPVWIQVARQVAVWFKFNNYIDWMTSDWDWHQFDNTNNIVVWLVAPAAAIQMFVWDMLIESYMKWANTAERTTFFQWLIAWFVELWSKAMWKWFVYENWFITDVVKSIKTQSEIDRSVVDEWFVEWVFMDMLRRTLSWWDRFSTTKIAGMTFDSIIDNDKISFAEYVTNLESWDRERQRRMVDQMYWLYDYEWAFNKNYFMSRIPLIWSILADGNYNNGTFWWVMKEYLDSNKLSALTNEYADPDTVFWLMDQINLNKMNNHDEALKLWASLTKDIAIEKWILKDKSTIWDIVMWEDDMDKWLNQLIFWNTWEEKMVELQKYWESRIAWDKALWWLKAKPYKPKDWDFEEFVAMAERLWWQATLKEYMQAYYATYRESAQKALLWKGKVEINKNINSPAYVEYVSSLNELSTNLVKDNWYALSREKNDWIWLINSFIENDPNMPIKKYQSAIGDRNSNISMYTNLAIVDDIGKREWYWSNKFLSAYSFMATKASNIITNMPSWTKEDIDKTVKAMWWFTNLMLDMWKAIETASTDNVTASLKKMWMATWLLPFINKLNAIDPDSMDKVLLSVWKENIERVINMFTDSMPVDMKTAYALVTWDNTNPDWEWWSGGKWRKMWSLWTIKKQQYRSNLPEILLNNYKKAVEWISKLPSRWFNLSPIKFTYGTNKKWELIETKIEIPRPTAPDTIWGNWWDWGLVRWRTRVDPISVKKWKVMTTTNTVKKLPKSAVSSRRIWV